METSTDTLPGPSIPAAISVTISVTLSDTLDAVVNVEKMISSLTAYKAELIDDARRISELGAAQAAALAPTATVNRGSSPTVIARRSLVAEIACALRIPERTAETLVERSRLLATSLPATREALRSGHISWRHVETITDHAFSLPESALPTFEDAVVPAAANLTVAKLDRKARRVRERIHPESITERREKSVADRNILLEPAHDGMAILSAYLPAETANGIFTRITDIATALNTKDEERNLAQVRADVFADLLIDGVTESGVGRGIVASVHVTVPVLTLLGTAETPGSLEGYGPIAPDVARRLAAHAPSFMRILTHPETGVVLSVGRTHYSPPADLARWVKLRDETCRHPGCNRAARHTQIDHTSDWQYGGHTAATNLASLCPRHHQLKHQTAWTVAQKPGGVLHWVAPSGRTYRTEPENDLPA